MSSQADKKMFKKKEVTPLDLIHDVIRLLLVLVEVKNSSMLI